MLGKLDLLVNDVGSLQVKLILLVGAPGVGKTSLLSALGKNRGGSVLNIGPELGKRLSAIPQKQRHLLAGNVLMNWPICMPRVIFSYSTISKFCSIGRCNLTHSTFRNVTRMQGE